MLYRTPPSENPLGIELPGPGRGGVLVEVPQGFSPFAPRSRYGWGTSVGNRRYDNTHRVSGSMSIAHNPLPPTIPPLPSAATLLSADRSAFSRELSAPESSGRKKGRGPIGLSPQKLQLFHGAAVADVQPNHRQKLLESPDTLRASQAMACGPATQAQRRFCCLFKRLAGRSFFNLRLGVLDKLMAYR